MGQPIQDEKVGTKSKNITINIRQGNLQACMEVQTLQCKIQMQEKSHVIPSNVSHCTRHIQSKLQL